MVQPTFHVTHDFYKILEKDDIELVDELDDDFIVRAMDDDLNAEDYEDGEEYDDEGINFKINFNEIDLFGEDENIDEYESSQLITKSIVVKSSKNLNPDNEDLEKKLADTMAEYDEDDDSELEDDPETQGIDDLSAYQEVVDEQFSKIKKSQNTLNINYDSDDNVYDDDEEEEVEFGTIKEKRMINRFTKFELQVAPDDSAINLAKEQMKHIVKYETEHAEELSEKLEKELKALSFKPDDDEFDCQSIISTYSNTENHPKLIARPNSSMFYIIFHF